jgi:hypothetical protein
MIVWLQYFLYRYINMPSQAEGGGSTRSLKQKAVNEAIGSGLVKTSVSWSWEEIKRIWISFFATLSWIKW